jgi:hypothetical protein
MGFWLHLHPGFASSRAFHTQLCKDLLSKYASTNLALLNLPPTFSEPDICFTPAKCKGSYVPFALKKSHPEVYGEYRAQQNAFLETHRYISIVGLHPDVMGYGDKDSSDPAFPASLWQTLSNMDGICAAALLNSASGIYPVIQPLILISLTGLTTTCLTSGIQFPRKCLSSRNSSPPNVSLPIGLHALWPLGLLTPPQSLTISRLLPLATHPQQS